MLYLGQLHAASVRSATVRTAAGALAFVGHTSIDILALPHDDRPGHGDDAGGGKDSSSSDGVEPFSKLATLPFHARLIQVASLASVPGSLLVLTDHPAPRLIVLVPDPAYANSDTAPTAYTTHTVVQLQDTVRAPADLGMGMCLDEFAGIDRGHTPLVFTHTYTGNARVVPLAAKALARPPSADNAIGALAGFDVRLPHPTLLQSTFLDTRNMGTGPVPPLVALLSLSSIPTWLPGLGPQCLPVLSFHWIDTDKQELTPCPWGPAPQPSATPSIGQSPITEDTSTSPSAGAGPSPRRSSRISSSGGSGRVKGSNDRFFGPSAKGADRSPAAILARDKKLAAQGIARAHVPIPYIEALGAHFILTLPARAGGGVLVFSETCVLYVPPPPSALGDVNAFGVGNRADSPEQSSSTAGGSSSSPAKGKRRKAAAAAGDADMDWSTLQPSTSPHEASSTVNEHGKRRRASEAATGRQIGQGEIIRTTVRKPMQVVAAVVQAEPPSDPARVVNEGLEVDDGVKETDADGRSAALRVLFATQAGQLHSLVLSLAVDGQRPDGKKMYTPMSMRISKIGPVPRPGSGAGGLLYLGDGFLQVASVVGDSALVRIDPDFHNVSKRASATPAASKEEWEDEDMDAVGPHDGTDDEEEDDDNDDSPSRASSSDVQEYKRFHNLGPIMDFVIDNGPGEAASPSSSSGSSATTSTASSAVASRIVTCSGTGPSGSLRTVKIGAELRELGTVALPAGSTPSAVFNLALARDAPAGDGTSVVLLSYPERTEGYVQSVVDGDLQWSPLEMDVVGQEATLAAAALDGGDALVVVSTTGARVVAVQAGRVEVLSTWTVAEGVTVAAVDGAGTILLASGSKTVIHLQVDVRQGGALKEVARAEVEDEVASLTLETLDADAEAGSACTIAILSFFVRRSVRLLAVPTLRDVTPELLAMQTFGALPCAVGLLRPGSSSTATARGASSVKKGSGSRSEYLLVGLVDGSLVSYRLERLRRRAEEVAGPESSQSPPIRFEISDRRTVSLGPTPIRGLVPLATTRGLQGVLVAGEMPVLLYELEGRLNYSTLSYGPLRAACATVGRTRRGGGAGVEGSEVMLLRAPAVLPGRSKTGQEVDRDGAGAGGHAVSSNPTSSSASASIHILQIGDVKKVEMGTLPLGLDNPVGIALDASEGKRAFGVITWRYAPEGEGAAVDGKGKAAARRGRDKGVRGKVIVVDQESFETIDTFLLEPGEHPHCIACVKLKGRTFFVVGTGWDNAMESETTSGRIVGLELVPSRWKSGDRELVLAFSQRVRGGVNAVVGPAFPPSSASPSRDGPTNKGDKQGQDDDGGPSYADNCLVAAINSQVVLYASRPSSSAERKLSLFRRGAWACAFFATTLVSPADDPCTLLVGDAMRSLVLLSLDVVRGRLWEVAREADASWTSAAEVLSGEGQAFVGADMGWNLWVSARTVLSGSVRKRKEAAAAAGGHRTVDGRGDGRGRPSSNTEPGLEGGEEGRRGFTHVIKRRGAFHLGDAVNRFRKGALVHAEGVPVLGESVRPNVVFGTAGGAVGLLADMGPRSYRLLRVLGEAVDAAVPSLGGIGHAEWRACRSEHREMAAVGVLDGAAMLVGRFLGLAEEARGDVVERWRLLLREEQGEEEEEGDAVDVDALVDAVASLARLS